MAPEQAVGRTLGPEADVIRCGSGADRVDGRGGNDIVRGGSGNDRLYGESGDDLMDGGPGDALVDGGSGDDRLSGGGGRDRLVQSPGRGPGEAAGAAGNELFTSATRIGYKAAPGRAEDGVMIEFALGIGAALFVHGWVRSAGHALGIPAVTVTVLAVLL